MGKIQSKNESSQSASQYICQLLIVGYIKNQCRRSDADTDSSTATLPLSVIETCRAYYMNSNIKNLVHYIHTLSLVEVLDLNDDTFTKFTMHTKLLYNINEQQNENFADFTDRTFNRCYCSYALHSNMTHFPQWLESYFTSNSLKLPQNSKNWGVYNVIFRCGGYYFHETMNNLHPNQLSDSIEVIIYDATQFLFYEASELNANSEQPMIEAFCVSLPTKLPTRDRYKMAYNAYNNTLLFTAHSISADGVSSYNDDTFVYELALDTLKWSTLIKNKKNEPIYGAHLCFMQNGKSLLQVGGVNASGEKLQDVRVYSYEKNKQMPDLPPMSFARSEALSCVVDELYNELIVAGGMKDKYHENKVEILNLSTLKWLPYNYIFNHNHREPLLFLDFDNNDERQIIYVAGNEMENFKRIGFVECIDLRQNYGKTIIGKWKCVGGGHENTQNKNINISIKQMFQVQNNYTPHVTLLQCWL